MRGRGHITIQQLSAETALHPHDIALAFMLLGFIKKQTGNKFLLSIDWTKVDSHMEKVKKSLRIAMDPDSLNWSPTPAAGILFESPLKSEPGSDSDSDVEDNKEASRLTIAEQRRGPGRPRKLALEDNKDRALEDRQEDSELEIKIGGGRRQILSTESESECAVSAGSGGQRASKRVSQSGECAGNYHLTPSSSFNHGLAGLDGGASTTTSNNRRKYNNSGRKKSHLTSGDSADGELSDDEVCAFISNKFFCIVC